MKTFKSVKNKTVKLKIHSSDHLWLSTSDSLIKDQPERFILMYGKAVPRGGQMYFCATYLEAAVLSELFKADAIYSDEAISGEYSGWVVVVSDKKKKKVVKKNGKKTNKQAN